MVHDISDEDVIFCNDYWFYLDTIQQIATRFQEVKKDVVALSNKVSTSLELMSFEVTFLGNTIPRKTELVLTEARNLLQSLIQIQDVNTFKIGSDLRHMLKAHAWKLEIQGITSLDHSIFRNQRINSRSLPHSLEHHDHFQEQ